MKKKLVLFFTLGVLLVSSFVFAACDNRNKAFIGTFNSTWIEGFDTSKTSTSFSLTVYSDKTFTLKRFENEIESFTSEGTWAGNTSQDEYGIICLVTSSGNSTVNKYFTLTLLDNGNIIASPGMSSPFNTYPGHIVIFTKA